MHEDENVMCIIKYPNSNGLDVLNNLVNLRVAVVEPAAEQNVQSDVGDGNCCHLLWIERLSVEFPQFVSHGLQLAEDPRFHDPSPEPELAQDGEDFVSDLLETRVILMQ